MYRVKDVMTEEPATCGLADTLEMAVQIAAKLGIYAYDAYLLRCAERYRAPLLTLDRALREHARSYGVQVLEIKV